MSRPGNSPDPGTAPVSTVGKAAENATENAEDEYPAERWPRIYGVVLGVLALDLVVFLVLTRWFS